MTAPFRTTGRDHWQDQPAHTRRDGARFEPMFAGKPVSLWRKAVLPALIALAIIAVGGPILLSALPDDAVSGEME